jgi:ribokinase
VIVVFGSVNLDFVTRVERVPGAGETVVGSSLATYPGGKGANQALAGARAGADVRLFAAVGRDRFADAALALLTEQGVDLAGVARVDAATGCATILVDAAGENRIVVVPGANALANPASVPDAALSSGTLVVLQQEVPSEANDSLLERARRLGARTLLNAAPARALARGQLRLLDFLVVNEHEAAALAASFGWPAEPEGFARAAVVAHDALTVVVTLGERGAFASDRNGALRAAAPPVAVVDTTGAGDAFIGAFAASLDRGDELVLALRVAVAAGSLACTIAGAQTALPHRRTIDASLPSVTVEHRSSW